MSCPECPEPGRGRLEAAACEEPGEGIPVESEEERWNRAFFFCFVTNLSVTNKNKTRGMNYLNRKVKT